MNNESGLSLAKYVPKLETCKKLKNAGLVQKSLYYWMKEQHTEEDSWVLTGNKPEGVESFSAYTVGELGDILCEIPMRLYPHQVSLMSAMGNLTISEAEFRSKMVLFLVNEDLMPEDWMAMWVERGKPSPEGEIIDAYTEMNKEIHEKQKEQL
mgnify:CR=1 FL=1|tara:strand:- start:704 stop:1162 length:459 start_codon:yes stop_codon:yes gene_type:complete